MQWLSNVKNALFPQSLQRKEEQETDTLVSTVDTDRKLLQTLPETTTKVADVSNPVSPAPTLSPFASRILEKAKMESLKEEEDRKPLTTPAELFMTNTEAKKRVDHIESITLEKNKIATNKFVDAAKVMPDIQFNAFAKKTEDTSE
jgi:hypothetical protein